MAGFGIANGRMGKINAYQEQRQKMAELAAVDNPVPDNIAYTDRPKPMQENRTSLANVEQGNNPYLDKMTWKNTGVVPMPGQGDYRTQALRDMNEVEFAKNQQAMNASDLEYWTEQFKAHPENSYAYANMMFASNETPAEKAKRERREQLGEVFNNLGNLIGNAANLYYTNKGGQYIDLNTANEVHRARMERLKEKQDALLDRQKNIIINAKLGEIKTQQAERAAEAKADADARKDELKFIRDLYLKEIDNAYALGRIDAQTAANMKRDAAKVKTDKELEDYRQRNRELLAESNHQRIIEREEARGGGSRATVRVPRKDGKGYDEYRKNDLTNPIVIAQIYNSLPDEYKSSNAPTLLTMQTAIGKALTDGKITEISSEIELTGKGEDKQAPYKKSNKKGNKNTPPQKV